MTDPVKSLREYLDDGPHDTYEPYEIAHEAITALEAVLELHEPSELYPAVIPGVIYCVSCWDGLTDEAYEYPCATVQAITDALGDDHAA